MLIGEKLRLICEVAANAAIDDYTQIEGQWFPKSILPQFSNDFLDASKLPQSPELERLGIASVYQFARGMDSVCFLGKTNTDDILNICIRVTLLKNEPQQRSSIDFNLQAHHTFTDEEHRLEILPLISMPKKTRGLALRRFLDTLCEETHGFMDTRLGLADIGVLPDGTMLNVDAGNCPMPEKYDAQDIASKFKDAHNNWEDLPEQLVWRSQNDELKQNLFFKNSL